MQEKVEKGTTRVHVMSSPVLFGSPCLSELPLVIGSSARLLELLALRVGNVGIGERGAQEGTC